MVFQKGQSGNPAGRPKKRQDLIDLAMPHIPKAIEVAAQILINEQEESSVRLKAAIFLTEQAYGKAPQQVQIEGGQTNFVLMIPNKKDDSQAWIQQTAIAQSNEVKKLSQ